MIFPVNSDGGLMDSDGGLNAHFRVKLSFKSHIYINVLFVQKTEYEILSPSNYYYIYKIIILSNFLIFVD